MNLIFVFLVLFSLLASIRGNGNNDTESTIALDLQVENNEGQSNSITTKDETENEQNIFNNETSKVKTKESIDANKNVSLNVLRSLRGAEKRSSYLGIECVSCYGSGFSTADKKCYKGAAATQKCAEVEQCFTELHPQYIKRGCTLPSSINRTFVCKCPLCNDKPSEDLTYYEYRTISDWEYDNKRLEEPVVGLELLCKICDTRGVNAAHDKKCKLGKNADYMQCGHNELCFTNIDHQIDFVSRGCIAKPAFNSMYSLCNESRCNNDKYPNPRSKRSEFLFRTIPLVQVSSSFSNQIMKKNVLTISILFYFVYNLHA